MSYSQLIFSTDSEKVVKVSKHDPKIKPSSLVALDFFFLVQASLFPAPYVWILLAGSMNHADRRAWSTMGSSTLDAVK